MSEAKPNPTEEQNSFILIKVKLRTIYFSA